MQHEMNPPKKVPHAQYNIESERNYIAYLVYNYMHFTVVVADMYTSNQCLPTYIPFVVTTSQNHLQISRLSEKL